MAPMPDKTDVKSWEALLHANPLDWLLKSNPWTRYRTLTDLLDLPPLNERVIQARAELIGNEQIIDLANETLDWQPQAATRNSDPKISYFKLKALAEFGLRSTDLSLQETVVKATAHIIDDMFAARGSVPERPKKGERYEKPDLSADVWHCAPCNSPIITIALLDLGVKSDQLSRSVETLKERWSSKEGWFCHLFFVESQYKKLGVGCPVAGLQALEVFSRIPELKESQFARNAFDPLKFHKEYGESLYYFGRSKKFWTLKYPYVWYNALYLADVLTRFKFTRDEPVVKELVDWIIDSQDSEGRFKPTSVFMNYKGWDFASKKEASPWITFLCCRILKQYCEAAVEPIIAST